MFVPHVCVCVSTPFLSFSCATGHCNVVSKIDVLMYSHRMHSHDK